MLRTGLHGLPLLALLLPGALGAQPGAEPRADLNQIALAWSRGDWRAPLVCTMEGTPFFSRNWLRTVWPGPLGAIIETSTSGGGSIAPNRILKP